MTVELIEGVFAFCLALQGMLQGLFGTSLFETKARTCERGTVQLPVTRGAGNIHLTVTQK